VSFLTRCCRLYAYIHNQNSDYKQILVKKNVTQETEVMVTENLYLVKKHQQQTIKFNLEHGVNHGVKLSHPPNPNTYIFSLICRK
jgi:hypothetical protein